MANYLGLDVGRKRVGLSSGDDTLRVAVPLTAVLTADREVCLRRIADTVHRLKISTIVVGYPLNMDNTRGAMAKYVEEFVADLRRFLGSDVAFIMGDERLTSVQAEDDLKAMGRFKFESPARKRKMRRSGAIDSNAAAIILQDYLDELALHTL
ncbi:MAG: Holliday junction resolvase RuvX [Puniceicoccales bacterium]|jgi:putative Holliday junction resolvase|nr:Holliday junction resolvase RuvX [Puniceicoccales bacterium]